MVTVMYGYLYEGMRAVPPPPKKIQNSFVGCIIIIIAVLHYTITSTYWTRVWWPKEYLKISSLVAWTMLGPEAELCLDYDSADIIARETTPKGGWGYFDIAGQFRQALKQPFACRPKQPKAILCPPKKGIALVVLNSPATSCKILFYDIIWHCAADKIAPPYLT